MIKPVRFLNAETIVPFQRLLEGAASFPTIRSRAAPLRSARVDDAASIGLLAPQARAKRKKHAPPCCSHDRARSDCCIGLRALSNRRPQRTGRSRPRAAIHARSRCPNEPIGMPYPRPLRRRARPVDLSLYGGSQGLRVLRAELLNNSA
jgi:hypothetical protein